MKESAPEKGRQRRSKASKTGFYLDLIRFLSENQGVSVGEVREAFGLRNNARTRREIQALETLGQPPFGPCDFLEIHLENDRVYSEALFGLAAHRNLSATEAVLLEQILLESSRPEAATTREALFHGLKTGELPRREWTLAEKNRTRLEKAIREKMPVNILYQKPNPDEPGREREILPLAFESLPGGNPEQNMYLRAWCFESSDSRLFYFWRVRDVRQPEAERARELVEQFAATRPPPSITNSEKPSGAQNPGGIYTDPWLFWCLVPVSDAKYALGAVPLVSYQLLKPETLERPFPLKAPGGKPGPAISLEFLKGLAGFAEESQAGELFSGDRLLVAMGFSLTARLLEGLIPLLQDLLPLGITANPVTGDYQSPPLKRISSLEKELHGGLKERLDWLARLSEEE